MTFSESEAASDGKEQLERVQGERFLPWRSAEEAIGLGDLALRLRAAPRVCTLRVAQFM